MHDGDARNGAHQLKDEAGLLASEFSEFIQAASKLEDSYRSLQEDVAMLSKELAERNVALSSSLAENERMHQALQQIVNSMPCGVLVVNREDRVTTINPECKRLLGLSGLKSGRRGAVTIHQISQWSGLNLESFVTETAGSDAAQEFCIRDAAGSRWIEARNRRLVGHTGKTNIPEQSILILRDISVQKRAEQEREAARKAMALAEIATILAHEIRNPLASLELFAGLIESDNEMRSEWISNLRAGIRSLSGTVNNVLSFHGSGSLKLAPIELGDVIGGAVIFARPQAEQAGVQLEYLQGAKKSKVDGNESALRQVLLNLITNAIRHTPQGGRVTVELSGRRKRDAEQLFQVTVTDTGCGIRGDQLEKIFEPGFSGSGDSSGLGLAVCERIMRQHAGRISAGNAVGAGARFTLEISGLPVELMA